MNSLGLSEWLIFLSPLFGYFLFCSYLKLDIVHITVDNTFQWFAGDKNELNAVHVETMKIMVRTLVVSLLGGA